MIANSILLDITPGPPSHGLGIGEVIFVAIAVLILTGAAIAGFVFMLRCLLRAKSPVTQSASHASAEFQPNSPNQP